MYQYYYNIATERLADQRNSPAFDVTNKSFNKCNILYTVMPQNYLELFLRMCIKKYRFNYNELKVHLRLFTAQIFRCFGGQETIEVVIFRMFNINFVQLMAVSVKVCLLVIS